MEKEIKKENPQSVAEAVSKTDVFFKENSKTIISAVIALIVIAAAVFCYIKFIYQPKVVEAQNQMFPAESLFRSADYELALNGDGNTLGFVDIIDQYGSKSGQAVYLYAGICELQLGNFEDAVKYLKKYKGKDSILAARALACEGDAYVGLEKYNEALTCFTAAAKKSNNAFSAAYLLKAGAVAEKLGNDDQALSFYKEIKENYPQSVEGYDVDKYISRIENK